MLDTKQKIYDALAADKFETPCKFTLAKPVVLTSTITVTELEFKRDLVAEDVALLPINDMVMGDFYAPIASMCEQPHELIKRLNMKDAKVAIKIVSSFLGDGEV